MQELLAASLDAVDRRRRPPRLEVFSLEMRDPDPPEALRRVSGKSVRRVRVPNSAHRPEALFMVLTAMTADEVQAVYEAVRAFNEDEAREGRPKLLLHLVVEDADNVPGLDVDEREYAEGIVLEDQLTTEDVWMQDWGEFVEVQVEGEAGWQPAVLDTGRVRGLGQFSQVLASRWQQPWVGGVGIDDTGDYGGNIEATPGDLLMLGSTASDELAEFFSRTGYGQRLVRLDTGWLSTGHVDELITALPAPDSELGWVALVADPGLGVSLLAEQGDQVWRRSIQRMVDAAFREVTRFPEIVDDDREAFEIPALVASALRAASRGEDFDRGEVTDLELPDVEVLVAAAAEAAQRQEHNLSELRWAVHQHRGPDVPLEVVRVPVLFHPDGEGLMVATLPNMTNMIVLPGHLLVPDPFVEAFRKVLVDAVRPLGYRVHFIPGLTYHVSEGQLHCGTQVLRNLSSWIDPRYEEAPR